MTEKQIKEKVAEWNANYRILGREHRLKDMEPSEYEKTVGHELLDICDCDATLALAVFKHPENQGGWMVGDVAAFLEGQVPDKC